jgi:hypothetical protein
MRVQGAAVHLLVWAASCLFLAANTALLVQLLLHHSCSATTTFLAASLQTEQMCQQQTSHSGVMPKADDTNTVASLKRPP